MEGPSPRSESNRHSQSSRPYRSKRQPPCDQCRRKKLRCDSQGQKSCQRCQASGSKCSFDITSGRRSALPELRPSPVQVEEEAAILTDSANIVPNEIDSTAVPETSSSFPILESGDTAGLNADLNAASVDDFFLPSQPEYHIPERPTPQAIQTLDQLKGFSSQVIGASGESDPWLLRHCKFDDHGFLLFHQVHFRNAGGVPLEEKIPVHFLVTADQLYDQTKDETRFPPRDRAREELNTLVPLECGQRLVSL